MKKLIISLLLVMTAVVSANAMSKSQARREARFLTDKMAWELDLTYSQMEDVYEINYDYFRSLSSVHRLNPVAYDLRNEELEYVLSPSQWRMYLRTEYFYVPVVVRSASWVFAVHTHYANNHYFYDAPHGYSTYRGAHANVSSFYRGRIETHRQNMHNGHKPQSSGNVVHNHGANGVTHRGPANNMHNHSNGNHGNHGNAKPNNGNMHNNNVGNKPNNSKPNNNVGNNNNNPNNGNYSGNRNNNRNNAGNRTGRQAHENAGSTRSNNTDNSGAKSNSNGSKTTGAHRR